LSIQIKHKYDVRVTKGFKDELGPYGEALAHIVKCVEAKNRTKIKGLTSIVPFEIKIKGLRPIKVYADPHKKMLLLQYLDEESALDRVVAKNRLGDN